MVLNIIHDNRRPEKYVELMNELTRQGISSYRIWDAVVYSHSVVASINASHRMIVHHAKEIGLKEVCIAEDDVQFPAIDGWQYFLRNKPESYDLYLGGTYMVSEGKPSGIIGFHLYCVSEKFYDTFLDAPKDAHIDAHFNNVVGDYHFCYPMAAIQRPGFSANNSAMANYNSVLKNEDVYR